jgi:hypothetical protein
VRQLIDRRESAAALKYAAIFTDAGLPGDFLAQLKDAAGAFNEGARAMEALCRASTRACEERVSFIVTLRVRKAAERRHSPHPPPSVAQAPQRVP